MEFSKTATFKGVSISPMIFRIDYSIQNIWDGSSLFRTFERFLKIPLSSICEIGEMKSGVSLHLLEIFLYEQLFLHHWASLMPKDFLECNKSFKLSSIICDCRCSLWACKRYFSCVLIVRSCASRAPKSYCFLLPCEFDFFHSKDISTSTVMSQSVLCALSVLCHYEPFRAY